MHIQIFANSVYGILQINITLILNVCLSKLLQIVYQTFVEVILA